MLGFEQNRSEKHLLKIEIIKNSKFDFWQNEDIPRHKKIPKK